MEVIARSQIFREVIVFEIMKLEMLASLKILTMQFYIDFVQMENYSLM
jgi:hypothetical protein